MTSYQRLYLGRSIVRGGDGARTKLISDLASPSASSAAPNCIPGGGRDVGALPSLVSAILRFKQSNFSSSSNMNTGLNSEALTQIQAHNSDEERDNCTMRPESRCQTFMTNHYANSTHTVLLSQFLTLQSHTHFSQLTTLGPKKSLSLQHFSNLVVERKNLVSYVES